ncbi:MAG: hypothetical protein HC859_15760 [Bacteroidia bacterium]|nr:hypothetical protein [Bacteroidia bacterium]
MKKWPLMLFPLALAGILLLMQKPKPPVVFNGLADGIEEVNLADTLPASVYSALATVKQVHGVRIRYADGTSSYYFEYETDHEKLLTAVGHSGFAAYARLADTRCREISFDDAHTDYKRGMTSLQAEETSFFRNINRTDYNFFECVKTPLKHTLVLDKRSNRTLHRVDVI